MISLEDNFTVESRKLTCYWKFKRGENWRMMAGDNIVGTAYNNEFKICIWKFGQKHLGNNTAKCDTSQISKMLN